LKETVPLYSTKQSSSCNGKQSQPELTVICAISGQWQKTNSPAILSHPSSSEQSQKVEKIVLQFKTTLGTRPLLAIMLHTGTKKFLSCDRSTRLCICLRLDLYVSQVLVLCVSVIFFTCDMYKSSLRHIHDPVLLSQDRNYTCNFSSVTFRLLACLLFNV